MTVRDVTQQSSGIRVERHSYELVRTVYSFFKKGM